MHSKLVVGLAIESVTVDGAPVTDLTAYRALYWSLEPGPTKTYLEPYPLLVRARDARTGQLVLEQTYAR